MYIYACIIYTFTTYIIYIALQSLYCVPSVYVFWLRCWWLFEMQAYLVVSSNVIC